MPSRLWRRERELTSATGEWSVHDLAGTAGTSTRTLRHYDKLGLLKPSRTGANGYRYYDEDSLLRLQRILLLRGLGLSLAVIAQVLDGERNAAAALRTHLELLEQDRDRLHRRIASVRTTLRKTEAGEPLMAAEVFDGFDHTRYKAEVVERWGEQAYERGDRWWRSLSMADRRGFQQRQLDIASDYGAALRAGLAPDADEVQAIVGRHFDWLTLAWQGTQPSAEALAGLGEMYATDPRFAQNYDRHGDGVAMFVRDAMQAYAQRNLS